MQELKPSLQSPQDIRPSIKEKGHTESFPFIQKNEGQGKSVTLTFNDLSYSVQVKNIKKETISDSKCNLSFF